MSISSERWFARNIEQLCRVSCVLNAVSHFSFSDESELQVQEFLYKDKLQLCSCFVEISGEFFPLYRLHSLLVNYVKIAVIMH